MICSSGLRFVYVWEPTYVLRIRFTVVTELKGTVYTIFLAPRVPVVRFASPATHNSLIKETLGSLDLPLMLESCALYRTHSKRQDGVTTIPWEMGEQLVCDVTIVDAPEPSRLNQGSLCKPGTTATEAESIVLQIGNAACVLGTVSDKVAFEEVQYIWSFFKPVYHYSFFETCFYWSIGLVTGNSSWLVFCSYWDSGWYWVFLFLF